MEPGLVRQEKARLNENCGSNIISLYPGMLLVCVWQRGGVFCVEGEVWVMCISKRKKTRERWKREDLRLLGPQTSKCY
jgi:hypothetical protein